MQLKWDKTDFKYKIIFRQIINILILQKMGLIKLLQGGPKKNL